MNCISINYTLKWHHKELPHYRLSVCKKMFNTQRGRMIKCVVNGGVVGWWIGRKFLPKSKVNGWFTLIKDEKLPF